MSRRGYVVALVAAVTALVASVAVTLVLGLGLGRSSIVGWGRAPTAGGPTWTRGPMPGGPVGGWMGGRTGGPMMGGRGGWSGAAGPAYGWTGSGPVTLEQARAQAQTWVSRYAAGATLDTGIGMPMGFRFTATKAGSVVAVIMVDDDTGSVWGRLWSPAGPTG